MNRYILGVDPSGNFHEGKGTTGWCVIDTLDNKIIHSHTTEAKNYATMEAYWDAQLTTLSAYHNNLKDIMVVIEDYLLYASKSESQINSKMETPKLIGVLQYYCSKSGIPYTMQNASLVKNRWTDKILAHKGYISKMRNRFYIAGCNQAINLHARDAIRHAVHYATFKNKEGTK